MMSHSSARLHRGHLWIVLSLGCFATLLFGLDLAESVVFWWQGQCVAGEVVPSDDTDVSRRGISFQYSVGEHSYLSYKSYVFPESLFARVAGKGPKVDVCYSPAAPEAGTPRPFVVLDVCLTLLWTIGASFLTRAVFRRYRLSVRR